MGLWKSLEGAFRVEIVSGDLSKTLTAIQNDNITLSDIRFSDILHMRASVSRSQFSKLQKLLQKRGEEINLLSSIGIYWPLVRLHRRPVLVIGILLILFLAILLPTRVLFVEVEGNQAVAARSILENADACGIRFFASRRDVRSEKMKNALLNAIPGLQWAGINTKGCVAVISVRERTEKPEIELVPQAGNVVATKDGIVEEITVLRGTPLCKAGQGVKKGQVLISGYTDCGLLIKVQRAEGEVFGQTFHHIEAVTPTRFVQRGTATRKKRKFMLRIGKNIINFTKDSGISDAECVKMYEEEFLTLPGGFSLPIALITETCTYTDFYGVDFQNNDFSWLELSCENYLKSTMIAGEVLQRKNLGAFGDEVYKLNGKYACKEMLGQIRYEEIINHYGS